MFPRGATLQPYATPSPKCLNAALGKTGKKAAHRVCAWETFNAEHDMDRLVRTQLVGVGETFGPATTELKKAMSGWAGGMAVGEDSVKGMTSCSLEARPILLKNSKRLQRPPKGVTALGMERISRAGHCTLRPRCFPKPSASSARSVFAIRTSAPQRILGSHQGSVPPSERWHAPEARWLLTGEKHRFRKSLRMW